MTFTTFTNTAHTKARNTATITPPTVSASTANVTRNDDVATVYANLRYSTTGEEFENGGTGNNYSTSRGMWLDSGNADQVWIERTVTAGSLNNVDFGSGRQQVTANKSLGVFDSNIGAGGHSATLTIVFYDAEIGGNTLQTITGLTLTATLFNACPLCCFTPDTLVTMADHTQKRIVDIKVGDEILVASKKAEEVTEIITRVERPMYKLIFEDGRILHASVDHPIWVDGKGYCSVHPQKNYKDRGPTAKLEIGDYVVTESDVLIKLVGIDYAEYLDTVYTLGNYNYFANGIIVG